ncbi:kinase-like protein [Rhizopogon salebrosus TDB-379]|nr:kinase-like protein [Rhizopogon salebrosus TDB-379]
MVFPSTWIFSKKWTWKSQAEIKVSESVHPSMGVDEYLADLTTKVAKESIYVTAQGGLGDVWKCRYSGESENIEVAVKCVRIEIPDERVKDIVNKRLMDDFFQWKQLKHDHILPVYGITHGFGPVPAIVSPWMHNGSLSAYLDKHHNDIAVTQKFALLTDVAAGLQYLHSKELAHTDLTGNNVLIDRNGRARIADYGLLATCTDLNGTSHLVDLTTKVVKESTYVTAQGGLGDVWKCRYSEENKNIEVAVKCVRIEIPDEQVKDFVNKRLMDDFFQWKQLKHDHILPVYGITYGFGPVPAIVSPWMHNGSLSVYLDKHHSDITVTQKFALLADVAAGLQYLHSKELAHTDLTGVSGIAV